MNRAERLPSHSTPPVQELYCVGSQEGPGVLQGHCPTVTRQASCLRPVLSPPLAPSRLLQGAACCCLTLRFPGPPGSVACGCREHRQPWSEAMARLSGGLPSPGGQGSSESAFQNSVLLMLPEPPAVQGNSHSLLSDMDTGRLSPVEDSGLDTGLQKYSVLWLYVF